MFTISRKVYLLITAILFAISIIWYCIEQSRLPVNSNEVNSVSVQILYNLHAMELFPKVHDVVVQISNPTAKPIRVIGISSGCYENCCFGEKEPKMTPFSILPGESKECIIQMKISAKASFIAPLSVYVDQGVLRTYDMELEGSGR